MRSNESKPNKERWSKNGYLYVKTTTGWKLKHRLVAEKKLGRELRENERIRFKDGDRTNLDPDNILVYEVRDRSLKHKAAVLEAKIEDMKAQLEEMKRHA